MPAGATYQIIPDSVPQDVELHQAQLPIAVPVHEVHHAAAGLQAEALGAQVFVCKRNRFQHPTREEQRVGFGSVEEQKPRLRSPEEAGAGRGAGSGRRGCSRLLMILLRMVRSSLTLISRSWGRREDGTRPRERPPLTAPEDPSATPRPTSPASCLKRALKFSSISSSESTCWMGKRGQSGAPRSGPCMGSSRKLHRDHSLAPCHFASRILTPPTCKWDSSPHSTPCPGLLCCTPGRIYWDLKLIGRCRLSSIW